MRSYCTDTGASCFAPDNDSVKVSPSHYLHSHPHLPCCEEPTIKYDFVPRKKKGNIVVIFEQRVSKWFQYESYQLSRLAARYCWWKVWPPYQDFSKWFAARVSLRPHWAQCDYKPTNGFSSHCCLLRECYRAQNEKTIALSCCLVEIQRHHL